jgi:hypothetical protein
MSRAEKVVELAVGAEAQKAAGNAAIKSKMAPKGSLKLPPLLEARRWEFLMPDGCFQTQALFDRILVMQIPYTDKSTFGDTGIIMPETTKARLGDEACRGIIVSAGLKALDNLRSNGVDLGHVIRFIRNAPWRMEVDNVLAKTVYELVMRDGDLIASEDLAEACRRGECRVEWDDEAKQHVYVDSKGKQWEPKLPWIQEDL